MPKGILACVLAAWSLAAAQAPAETASPTTGDAEDREVVPATVQLDKVVVTARRRNELQQDVPQAITAVDGEELESRGADNLSALGAVTPNLTVYPARAFNGSLTAYIRGIGQFDPVSGAAYVEGGHMWLFGTVTGNVVNNGPMQLTGNFHWAGTSPLNRIQGDFRQNATGTLGVPLPYGDSDSSYRLSITGRADIKGGTLWLYREWDWDWGEFPVAHQAGWRPCPSRRWRRVRRVRSGVSPGLFIEGNARYETNDVWFDLYRVSVAEAMATAGTRPLAIAIASASNIDAALARADEFASMPATTLTDAQRRFLASVAAFLWMPDMARANRALDSLAGHAHASMQDMLHEQTAEISSRLDKRLADLPYSIQPQAWSDDASARFAGQSFDGLSAGIDQWLSPHLLVGSSVTSGQARCASTISADRAGANRPLRASMPTTGATAGTPPACSARGVPGCNCSGRSNSVRPATISHVRSAIFPMASRMANSAATCRWAAAGWCHSWRSTTASRGAMRSSNRATPGSN